MEIPLQPQSLSLLNEGIKTGRIQKGQLILMEAFGGGFTWGSSLVRI
jgi:3-oxoacyl-[acyl-carrier-protein] synthase-3